MTRSREIDPAGFGLRQGADDGRGNESPSDRLDLRHASTDHATIVVVPERRLLAIGGVGSFAGADFKLASDVLRVIATDIRRRLRREQSASSPVADLESAWWTNAVEPADMSTAWAERSDWHWQQMIEIPSVVTDATVDAAIDEARRNAGRDTPLVRLVRMTEGRAAQMLHVGSRPTESDTLGKLYEAVVGAGLRPRGQVHQIVLADPDIVPTGRAASIFRLPIEDV
jgi:hypothetical protein